ncbi:MAG: B12-binding domain-containing radical SAM protein [Nitrospirae bacterium]|nr:B12-binding domain-containing radical SAM protein [Nitrospirota bacterium]
MLRATGSEARDKAIRSNGSGRRTVRRWSRGPILLIYPSSKRYSGFMSTNRFPFLYTAHAGLPILAEILSRKGYEVAVHDDNITPITASLLRRASFVGISVETLWATRGYEIARMAKDLGLPVAFGGAHATLNPSDALDHGDYVIRNEGEHSLPDLLDAFETGRPLETVLGLSFRDGRGRVVHNPERPFLTTRELDQVPWPNLRKIHGWSSPVNLLGRYIYFTMVSRGCPFHCNFCSITPEFGKAYRHRSVSNVIDELKDRYDPKTQFLFFMDDSIAGDTEYLKELLEEMLSKNVAPRIGWHSQMRSDTAKDKKLVRLMQRTHCLFATFGFESIDDRTLRYMRKGQNLKLIQECIRTMQAHDIIVNGFFMLGSDHDTVASIRETVDFALKNCVIAGFMPMTPFPGTPFFADLEREGRIFTRHWELYDVQHVVYWPKQISPYDLYMGCLDAYRKFYTDQPSMFAVKMRRAAPKLFRALRLWNPVSYLRPHTHIFNLATLWPLLKLVDYGKEIAANLDYIAYLRSLDRDHPREFVPRAGLVQDVLSWRPAKKLMALAA